MTIEITTETTEDQYPVFPKTQLEYAWLLARKYGHEWASNLGFYDIANQDFTQKSIADLSRANRNGTEIGGILCPQVNEFGDIVHTTSSGRLDWTIHPNGVIELDINRPAGRVLHCVLGGYLKDIHYCDVVRNEEIPLHLRHLQALREAMHVFYTDWNEVDESVLHLTRFVSDEDENQTGGELRQHSWFVWPAGSSTGGGIVTGKCEHEARADASRFIDDVGKIVLLG